MSITKAIKNAFEKYWLRVSIAESLMLLLQN